MKRTVHGAALAICAAAALALAGCGGGGGDAPAGTTPNTSPNKPPANSAPRGIEGIWTSQNADADNARKMIILDDGSLWGNYGAVTAGNYIISGIFHGHASSSDGNLVSASYQQYEMIDYAPRSSGSFFGNLVDRSILSLILNGGRAQRFDYDNSYDQPVSLDARSARSLIQGRHMGQTVLWRQTSLGQTVAQGAAWIGISGSTLSTDSFLPGSDFMKDCAISGILAPRGEVGVFNTQLTFVGKSCKAGNGVTYSGIIYFGGDRRNFSIMAVTPDERNAFYFISQN